MLADLSFTDVAFTMNAAMARRLKLRYRWPSLRAALLTGAPRAEEGTLPL